MSHQRGHTVPVQSTGRLASYLILTIGALLLLFPLAWMVSTSLKTPERVAFSEIELIPYPVAWWNYVRIFREMPMFSYVGNSLKIVGAALFGGIVTCSLAGYAFARIRFPGRDTLFLVVLSTMMLPYVVRLIPLYLMFDQARLINTFWPLMLPRLLGHDAFFIFLYRQFFRGIPEDLFDAARVDGASELGIWRSIILPLSKPVLATVGIFAFQHAWGDYLWPLIYVGSRKANWTLALAVTGQSNNAFGPPEWNIVMAMTVVMVIPVLLVFAWGQRHITEGVTTTGIRG
ncbi:MAG: carbohydrate ABC transporter permease [Chloroflexi bacterium]|nr:carbohydrate ABC transporter permease [Chloroflexota bacterium]